MNNKCKVKIVAELTTNHFGNSDRLKSMIFAAADAGANYIKLQKRDVVTTDIDIKNEFETSYIDAVTPQNSIFNMIHKEHDVYDIKVQTLESVGDDQFTFTANNFNLTNDDVFSGDNSARMHLFWENPLSIMKM